MAAKDDKAKDESEATLKQTDIAEAKTEAKAEEKAEAKAEIKVEKKAKSKLAGTGFFYRGVQVQFDSEGEGHGVSGPILANFGDLSEDDIRERIDGILDFSDSVVDEEPVTD